MAARRAKRSASSSLTDLTVYELKAVCRAKGLKVSGRKAELVDRIASAPPGVRERPPRAAAAAPPDGAAAVPATAAPAPQFSPPPPSPLPSRSSSPPAGVEVVTGEEAGALDAKARRAARRERLKSYFEEELSDAEGTLEALAGTPFARALGRAPSWAAGEEARLRPADADARRFLDAAHASGRRLAWCSSYDAGVGRIVDLEDRSEWAVDVRALRVSEHCGTARLTRGEFVEYAPEAARERAAGAEPAPAGWVCGILGWPLMCDRDGGAGP